MNPDLRQPSNQPAVPSPTAPYASSTSLPAGIQVGSLDNFSGTVDARSTNTIADVTAMVPRKFVAEPDIRSRKWWIRKLKTILIIVVILLLLSILFWILKATVFKTKPAVNIPTVQTTANLNDSSNQTTQNPGTLTISRDLIVTNGATFEKNITVQGNGSIGGNLIVTGNINAGGTVTAGNFIGNGSGLTGIRASNCTDCTRQQGAHTIVQTGNIHIGGSVQAANFIGDGSQLTGIPRGCDTCVALQPSSPGTAQNGNININGNIQGASGNFQGQVITGDLVASTGGGINAGLVRNTVASTIFTGAKNLYNDSVRWSAVGADGFVRLVYFDNDWKDMKFVRCTNQDCTTKVTTILDSNPNGLDVPSVTTGPDGLPRILYMNYNGPSELHLIHCTNQDCTAKTNTAIATGSLYENSLAIGGDGMARISFVDYTTPTQLQFIHCTNTDCTSKVLTSIGGSHKPEFSSTYLGPDGLPRIAYEDYSTNPQKLNFIRCLDADCTGRTAALVLTAQLNSIYHIAAANGPDGLSRIALTDQTVATAYVKFVRCTNADCSSSVITNVASISPGKFDVSGLSIGSDGFARIAYDANQGGVSYVNCMNADCTAKNTLVIEGGGYGYPSTMVLGNDGFARVIYYRYSDKTLHFARLTSTNGYNTAVGSSIGSSALPYGQITATSLTLQGDLQNALLLKNSAGDTILNVDSVNGAVTIEGNVGIGTTASTAKLDVVSATVPAGRFAYTGAVTQTSVAVQAAGGLEVDGDSNLTGSAVFIKGSVADGLPGQIYTGYFGATEPGLILGTYSNRANQLTLATSSFVGIGNTAPAYKLDVSGDINSSTALRVGGNIVCTSSGCIGGGGGSFFTQGGNSFGALGVIGTNDNNALAFRTNGVEAVRINTSGKVGIGTTAPGNLLAVGALTAADASGQIAVSTGGVNNKGIIIQAVAAQNADLLQAQDSAGAVLASIDKVGNLTVKNATVNGTLSVNGHVITANASGTTTITAGAAACTTPTVSVAGNDTSGTITIASGTGCAAGGILATISFANAYGAAPRVVVSADNTSAAALQYYTTGRTTAKFDLSTNTTPANTTTYTYNYQVLQ